MFGKLFVCVNPTAAGPGRAGQHDRQRSQPSVAGAVAGQAAGGRQGGGHSAGGPGIVWFGTNCLT